MTAANFAQAQTTTFTYQGRLTDNGGLASGTYDFEFQLYNTLPFPTTVGLPVEVGDVQVTNGIFTVRLNFPASSFTQATGIGNGRSLEIRVRPGASTGAYELLTPRQSITAAPLAIAALNSQQLGGVAASSYLQTDGDGSGLTNLNASNVASGSLADTQLSANVAFRNQANTFEGDQTINGNLTQNGALASFTNTSGFLAVGTFGTGAIPATGAGTRMMWYGRKGAFRAGRVVGDEWDDANIGDNSTALGSKTTASGISATAIGTNSTASGTGATAIGIGANASGASAVALGDSTTASGLRSIALGYRASTNGQDGSFVYADNWSSNPLQATAPNQFVVRAQNIWLGKNNAVVNTANRFLETSTGAYLSTGGAWTNSSSINLKTNFVPIDSRSILQKVLTLPIQTWNYKSEDRSAVHLGATAQDFRTAFNLGADDEHISTVDADGVALAAIQGLHEELKDRDAKIEAQQKENDQQQTQIQTQQTQIERQQKQIDALNKFICANNREADVCRPEEK